MEGINAEDSLGRRAYPALGEVEGGEGGDDFLGFEGDGDDLSDEAEDVVVVVGAVGVVDDAGAGVGGDAVLVDHPFEGGKCQIGNVLLFLSYFPVFQSPSANIKRRYEAYRFGAMCRRGWPGVGV